MGFLDNLENNLKSLESAEEAKADAEREQRVRESERADALAAAPYAEELKKGAFGAEALKQAARIGHSLRIKVRPLWIGSSLRLEAGDRRLELRPTPEGVRAVRIENHQETSSEPVDLNESPEPLIREWLAETQQV